MSRYDDALEGIKHPDPHRPVGQWNGVHHDQWGNHVLCGPDGLWQIETPRALVEEPARQQPQPK